MDMRCKVNLHQRPGASKRETGSLSRMSVLVRSVLSAVQENEVEICLSHNLSQSHENLFERPLQSVVTKDCRKGSRGVPADNDFLHNEQHTG